MHVCKDVVATVMVANRPHRHVKVKKVDVN